MISISRSYACLGMALLVLSYAQPAAAESVQERCAREHPGTPQPTTYFVCVGEGLIPGYVDSANAGLTKVPGYASIDAAYRTHLLSEGQRIASELPDFLSTLRNPEISRRDAANAWTSVIRNYEVTTLYLRQVQAARIAHVSLSSLTALENVFAKFDAAIAALERRTPTPTLSQTISRLKTLLSEMRTRTHANTASVERSLTDIMALRPYAGDTARRDANRAMREQSTAALKAALADIKSMRSGPVAEFVTLIKSTAPFVPQPVACSVPNAGASYLRMSAVSLGFAERLPGISRPLTCATPPSVHHDPRLFGMLLDGGTFLGVGEGGQIYSIYPAGTNEDFTTPQKYDAFWVDAVFQAVATNAAIARPEEELLDGRWFYHQAGTYSRGPLEGKDAFYSPLVWHEFGNDNSVSMLHLAQMAHVNNSDYAPDRYLVYTKMRDLGDGVLEVTNAWFNHTKQSPDNLQSFIDRFNFPWGTLGRAPTGPVNYVARQVRGQAIEDISAVQWPTQVQVVPNVSWIGGFKGANEPGMAVVVATSSIVKAGHVRNHQNHIIGVEPDGDLIYGNGQFEVIAVATNPPVAQHRIRRGEIIASRYYYVFGTPAHVAAKAATLQDHARTAKVTIPYTQGATDLQGLCVGASGRMTACSENTAGAVILRKGWCSGCLPVYEVYERATQRYRYSTDPYMGETDQSYLTDNQYRIDRIVGWLNPSGAEAPAGYTVRTLVPAGAQPIEIHASDAGAVYLTKN